MASKPWAFICPSSRGIGQALTRRLLLTTSLPILATTRHHDPSATRTALLEELRTASPEANASQLSERLHIVRCDVTDEASLEAASSHAAELFPSKSHHLHLACVMPGILHAEKSPAQVSHASAMQSFEVNAVGPLLAAKYFSHFLPRKATRVNEDMLRPVAAGVGRTTATADDGSSDGSGSSSSSSNEAGAAGLQLPQLPRHATWLSMAARVGSTTDNRSGGWYSYRASKAAVFSLMHGLDLFLKTRSGDKAVAVAYHPGTVKTDFTREYWRTVPEEKLFSTEYATQKMMEVICALRLDQRGKCLDWKGTEVPP